MEAGSLGTVRTAIHQGQRPSQLHSRQDAGRRRGQGSIRIETSAPVEQHFGAASCRESRECITQGRPRWQQQQQHSVAKPLGDMQLCQEAHRAAPVVLDLLGMEQHWEATQAAGQQCTGLWEPHLRLGIPLSAGQSVSIDPAGTGAQRTHSATQLSQCCWPAEAAFCACLAQDLCKRHGNLATAPEHPVTSRPLSLLKTLLASSVHRATTAQLVSSQCCWPAEAPFCACLTCVAAFDCPPASKADKSARHSGRVTSPPARSGALMVIVGCWPSAAALAALALAADSRRHCRSLSHSSSCIACIACRL